MESGPQGSLGPEGSEPALSLPLSLPSGLPSGVSHSQQPSLVPSVSRGISGSFGGTAGLRGAPSASLGDRGPGLDNRRGHTISRASLSAAEQSLLLSDGAGNTTQDGEVLFIWGTNIHLSTLQARLRRFFSNFQHPGAEQPKYMELMSQLVADGDPVMNVDCLDLLSFDPTVYQQMVSYPAEVMTIMDSEAQKLARQFQTEEDLADEDEDGLGGLGILCKPYNLRETRVIRDLNPSDVDNLISVSGMVTRTSNVIPDLRQALFQCQQCGQENWVRNDRSRVEEPTLCPNDTCRARFSFRLVHNRSVFNNKQVIKMQENPNAIPEGETPHSVTMLCFEDMIDVAKPGDRVTVTGIYKALPVRVNPRQRAIKSVYKTHIMALHVHKDGQSELFSLSGAQAAAADEAATQEHDSLLSPEGIAMDTAPDTQEQLFATTNLSPHQVATRIAELRAMSQDPDIYDKLTVSIAPSIWELDDVKRGILCQLFGGTSKSFTGGRIRGEMNVLLVGDPGVSKSQLLTYVNKLAPRGLYTSGRGSSAVGLTAYVTKDPETREMVLESGALVLSDRGVCCIDEFDKMSDSARSMLHEVMEQQTVSVAKGGMIAVLNARTSVLAAANPVGSRYNPRLSVIDNIHLPPSLLSRFDLIYLVLDRATPENDKKLAHHLVSMYFENRPAPLQALIPADKLRDYIAYARARCHPELTEPAAAKLVDSYLSLRGVGTSRKVVTATPRQLESLIRLSEAQARMRLRDTVIEADVDEALRLMKAAMQDTAIDPETGAIDMDIINTGISSSRRTLRSDLAKELRELLLRMPAGATLDELATKMGAQSSVPVQVLHIREALATLEADIIHEGNRVRHKNAA